MNGKKYAIVGNGTSPDYTGMAEVIDSFDNVIRFGRSMYPLHIKENIPKVGKKMTIFAHNCSFEIQPMETFDRSLEVWLVVPDESRKDKGQITTLREKIMDMGFENVVIFKREEELEDLRIIYGMKNPTSGLRAIMRVVRNGGIPVLFNFSQHDDLRHHYDKTFFPKGIINMSLEREIVQDMLKGGLLEIATIKEQN